MSDVHKILVIRFSSVGDIVLASPLVRCLRTRFPSAQIDLVTRAEYADLLRSNHNLNYTYAFDAALGFPGLRALKRRIVTEGYDLIVDIHNSLRSRFLRSIRGVRSVVVDKRVLERTALVKFKKNLYRDVVSVADRYLEPVAEFGVSNDGKGLELHITDEVLFGVNSIAATWNLRRFEKVIALCPGSRHMTKRWPGERYAEVGALLVKRHQAGILLFGGPEETDGNAMVARRIQELAGSGTVVDLTGSLSLIQSAAAMEYADVVVTNDSGLMHIACARQRPVVSIFGSTVREFGFFPVSNEASVLEVEGLSCRPCSHIGRSACPEGHLRCLMNIDADRVIRAVEHRLHPARQS